MNTITSNPIAIRLTPTITNTFTSASATCGFGYRVRHGALTGGELLPGYLNIELAEQFMTASVT
uniref:hypothetical protein n=1 Tax=Nocardia donostiensis TaxID=1538463 RepID=UPI00111C5043|nr:hypothetical protein [Nocardia donostiensis]